MAKNKKIACWLLLIMLMIVSVLVSSVGVAQARYQHTDTAVAAVQVPDDSVRSNCLVTKQDAPRTVLLGELDSNEIISIPFWMLSPESDKTEKLNWGVADPEYAGYLSISVFAGYEELKADSKLELLENIRLDLLLCVQMTDMAREMPHEALKIPVHVTWGEEMWGTFQVMIPEVKEEEDLSLPEDFWTEPDTETVTESTTEEITEPTTEQMTESVTESETESTTETGTELETEETSEPATDPTTGVSDEISDDSTEPGEPVMASEMEYRVVLLSELTTEPTTEVTTESITEETTEATTETTTEATTEPTTEPTPETTTEPTTELTTEPTEESVPSPVNLEGKEGLIQLMCLEAFHPAQLLPVRIELPEEITSIRLGVEVAYGDTTYFEPYPDYTMFSLDGGASYYMVYGDKFHELVLEKVTELPLLLDFQFAEIDCSYVDEKEQEKMNLAMEAYVGEQLIKSCSVNVVISSQPSGEPVLRPRVQQTETETPVEDIIIENDVANQMLVPVLTFEDRLDFIFPVEWKDAKLEYSVDVLTMTEEQKLEYVPVTLTRDGLNVIYNEQMHKLSLRLGDQFREPGTYRLNMTWSYKDICFSDTKTTFFIQYSPRTDEMSSQEVPNDN